MDDPPAPECQVPVDRSMQHASTLYLQFHYITHLSSLRQLLLNKTCRYCPHCDLLIAHQNELEEVIARVFSVLNPEIVSNKYLVVGTLDRADWKRIDQNNLPIHDTIEVLHDFKDEVSFKPMWGWSR